MKILPWSTIAVTMLAFLSVGCQTLPQARVVRLRLHSDGTHWFYSLNSIRPTVVSEGSLTNQLSRLHLRQGDLILFGIPSIQNSNSLPTLSEWLFELCYSNRVAKYVYYESADLNIFSTPVYHWTAPFNMPRTLAQASFFIEGEFLGRRIDGYRDMLRRLERTRPKRIFLLGSLYDLDSGFSSHEAPY